MVKSLLLTATPFFVLAQGNYFAGGGAGAANTTGISNSFVGVNAGHANTTGYYNSFVGNMTGAFNKTGIFNSFIGSLAGYANTTGSDNSFVGFHSGYSNETGTNNSFLGSGAGLTNTTGSDNSFVGANAGYFNKTGTNNSFIGSLAGFHNTSGSYNSFLGYRAGFSNKTGNYNSFLGFYAGYFNTTGYNNSFVGYAAGYSNTTGNYNSFLGYYGGFRNTTGYNNSMLGYSAGSNNVTGYNNTALGYYANFGSNALTNATAIGYLALVNTSNSLVLGSISGVNGATADTKVGIRTASPAYNLHVNGTAAKPGGGSWTVASDQRLKQDITDFKDGLASLEKIRPVWFRYNGKAGMPTDKAYVGVIAQEMQKIAPYTVGEFVYQDSTGKQEKYLDYDANALTYMLVNAVKELKQENQQLKTELANIKTMLQPGNAATSVGETGSEALLWQNEPNPTDGNTVIRYYLPLSAQSAQLKLYSITGEEIRSIEIKQRGKGQVQLSGQEFASGMYIYRLYVNGNSVASKKLVLEK